MPAHRFVSACDTLSKYQYTTQSVSQRFRALGRPKILKSYTNLILYRPMAVRMLASVCLGSHESGCSVRQWLIDDGLSGRV